MRGARLGTGGGPVPRFYESLNSNSLRRAVLQLLELRISHHARGGPVPRFEDECPLIQHPTCTHFCGFSSSASPTRPRAGGGPAPRFEDEWFDTTQAASTASVASRVPHLQDATGGGPVSRFEDERPLVSPQSNIPASRVPHLRHAQELAAGRPVSASRMNVPLCVRAGLRGTAKRCGHEKRFRLMFGNTGASIASWVRALTVAGLRFFVVGVGG